MYVEGILFTGEYVSIVVRSETEARLSNTCFRGPSVRCAGNFIHWGSSRSLFGDTMVQKQFLLEIQELRKSEENLACTHSVSFSHKEDVGWAGTDSLHNYLEEELERFYPNRRSSAFRVCDHAITAPKTNRLTLVFELKIENERLVAVIHSIYPGDDVGDLTGDVSARENIVFFGWNHPGE